mmetsp:Transcript_114016/g.285247  ORF Transcript_114016/g.285247 Transcript_114016/m.285247 type:complete len:432 (-) Transcript_114016:152-1447(-)
MKAPDCVSCLSGMRMLASPQSLSCFPRRSGSICQAGSQEKLGRSNFSQSDVLSTVSTADSESHFVDPTLADASQEDLNAAAALQAIVEADDALLALVRRHQGGESLAALCMRFTRARPNSQAKALQLLTADVQYRDEHQMQMLHQMPLRDVFGLGQSPDAQKLLEAVCQQAPHGILGHDKQGRVVMYRRYTSMRLWELQSLGIGAQEMLRHHQWMTEKCLRAMGHKGRWVMVADIDGVGLSQVTSRTHLTYVRLLAELDAAHFPERLGTVFVINAPRFFSSTFKLVTSWLDERTKARCQLLGGPDSWRGALSEFMDLRILPRELGGETDLSFEHQAAAATPLLKAHSRSISSLTGSFTEDEVEGEELTGKSFVGCAMTSSPTSSCTAGKDMLGGGMASRSYCNFASVLLTVALVFAVSSSSLIPMDSLTLA